MDLRATPDEVREVEQEIEKIGFRPFINPGVERKVIAVLGEVDVHKANLVEHFSNMQGVSRVELISDLWKLASRSYHPDNTVITVGDVSIGGTSIAVAAGPCSVEDEAQTLEVAEAIKRSGAQMLRGGAFKPRTSPYSFQGLGEKALKIMARVRDKVGLPIVTEVMDTHE